MNPLPNWVRFWRKRIEGWWLETTDLWCIVTDHKCLSARIAAIEIIIDSVCEMTHDDTDDLLRLVNKYMPDNRHLIVACDQLITHLNDHLDELEREAHDWQREMERRHFAYQYSSYSF